MGPLLLTLALAAPVPTLVDPVTDQAKLVPDAGEAALDGQLRALRERTGVQGAVLTVYGIPHDHTIETFALATASQWGGGTAGSDRGFLVVIAKHDRRSRIEVGYGLEGYITDAEAGAMLQRAAPHFRDEAYDAGLAQIVDEIGGQVASLRPGQSPSGGHQALAGLMRASPHGALLRAIAASMGGLASVLWLWGFWGVGPPKIEAERLHRVRWLGPKLVMPLGMMLGWYLFAFGSWRELGEVGLAWLGGAALFGPIGAMETASKGKWGTLIALFALAAVTAIDHWVGVPVSAPTLGAIAIPTVAAVALSHGGGTGGGSSDDDTSSHSSTSSTTSSSSSSSGGDWGGGGGGFGGGGASGGW